MATKPRRAPRATPAAPLNKEALRAEFSPPPTVNPSDDGQVAAARDYIAARWSDLVAAHITPRLCDATRRERVALVMLVEALALGTVDMETCVAVIPAGHTRSGRPELIKLGWTP